MSAVWTFLTITLPGFFKFGAWFKSIYESMRDDRIDDHFNDNRSERNAIIQKIKKAKSDKERNKLLDDLVNIDK